MKNKKYTSFDKCSSFFSYWISPAEDLLLIKKMSENYYNHFFFVFLEVIIVALKIVH